MGFLILAYYLQYLFAHALSQLPLEAPKLQKQFGKYCGILQETTDALEKNRIYNCHGVVWALDENRLYITGFTFQPSIYRPENITFWIGPSKEPPKFADEIIPSENGIYLEPKELPLQTFLFRNNTFKIAKKPSTQEVSGLLSLLNSAGKKQAQDNSTLNSTKVIAKSRDIVSSNQRIKAQKGGGTTEIAARSDNKSIKVAEPRPAAEPVPKAEPPSHFDRSINESSEIDKSHNRPAPRFEKTVELSTDSNRSSIRNSRLSIDTISNHRSLFDNNPLSYHEIHPLIDINRPLADYNKSSIDNLNQLIIDHLSIRPLNQSISLGRSDIDSGSGEPHEIDLIVGGGATVKVTAKPHTNKWKSTISPLVRDQQVNQIIDLLGRGSENDTNGTIARNETGAVANMPVDLTTTTTTVTTSVSTRKEKRSKLKPLSWYAGAQPLILETPPDRQLSEFRWLSVWDHTFHYPIATLLLPSGPGFVIPKSISLAGFKAALSKDVRSGAIEIIDSKTIRVHNFHFEGDAPGAWFYVGRSLIPVATGDIIPIYDEEKGIYDCDYLGAYKNKTVTLKLPGDLEATDVFWLSVFCIPYGISFAHVYLPYKDLNVPTSMDFQPIPRCILE